MYGAARVRREARRHLAVHVGEVGVAARDPAVVPLVAPRRDDLPAPRLRLDPVLAPDAARLRLDLRHVLGERGRAARRTRAAAASAWRSVSGPSTATSSPPIVHSSAAPPARPKNERRVVGLSAMGARSLVRAYSLCKYDRTGYDVARARRHRLARRGLRACPRRDRRRDGPDRRARGRRRRHPSPRGRRGRRVALLDHLALRRQGGHPDGRAALDGAARGGPDRRRSPIASTAPTSTPRRGPRSWPTGCSSRSPASARSRSRCTACRSSCSARPRRARCTATGG